MTARDGDEMRWERRLNISTGAAAYEKDDAQHSRYEPTSYAVLERLAGSGYVGRGNVLVDYGCGKGRVSFYMTNSTGCRSVGVEYDGRLCEAARANLAVYSGRNVGSISFECIAAEEYRPEDADCFYFFNPFSAKILRTVIGKIVEAYCAAPKVMCLFFYYMTDEYYDVLMNDDMLRHEGEIDCRDLFHNEDQREKIQVFSVGWQM